MFGDPCSFSHCVLERPSPPEAISGAACTSGVAVASTDVAVAGTEVAVAGTDVAGWVWVVEFPTYLAFNRYIDTNGNFLQLTVRYQPL